MNVGQPPLLRRLNETAVLEALRKSGPMSRAELSRQLSLSKSTISQVVADLLSRGLVREVATARPGPAGRTATLLDIAPEAGFVAGADVGGTLVRVAIADLKGEIRARLSAPTAREGLAALLDQLDEMVHRAMAQAGAAPDRLLAAGVGVPGAVDTATGAVRLCPNLRFLDGVTLGSHLEERLRCGVVVDNDVNLGAIGEKWRGCADRAANFAYMAVGTGVGMGVVLDAVLYRGTHGFAGEVGYLPVPVGDGHRQLEEIVAGPAIARAYLGWRSSAGLDGAARGAAAGSGSAPGALEGVDARQVFDRARQGDPAAAAVVRRVADALGWAIASATAVLDLSLVVLGGGVGLNADLLLEPVRSRVAELVPFAPEIRISALGGDATLFGAIAVALRQGRTLVQQRQAVRSGRAPVMEVSMR